MDNDRRTHFDVRAALSKALQLSQRLLAVLARRAAESLLAELAETLLAETLLRAADHALLARALLASDASSKAALSRWAAQSTT